MVYLNATQMILVYSSKINFDSVLNDILIENCPCNAEQPSSPPQPSRQQQQQQSNQEDEMDTTEPDNVQSTDNQYPLLTENDIVKDILDRGLQSAVDVRYRPFRNLESVKRHADSRYYHKLNYYAPSITNKSKNSFLTKAKKRLNISEEEEECEPSALCKELKRKRDEDFKRKRKRLHSDFVKCKKYKEDPSVLVELYSKYKVSLDQFASIQIDLLTRWAVTECYESKFVKGTYQKTFFNAPPPFDGNKLIVDDQIRYMKNMYTIRYNEDNHTRIEASPSMVKLAANMHSLFISVYGNVIDDYHSIAKTCYECIKFANSGASSVNNISSKAEYNSLSIVLWLSMVYNQQTFDDLLTKLADERFMTFDIDEGFTGEYNLIMDIIELDFYLVKPFDRLYKLLNPENPVQMFDFLNPLNVLCLKDKCFNEVLPGIYAEFCILRFIAVLISKLENDAQKELSSLITSKIKHLLENWTGIGNDLPSSSTHRVLNYVSDNLSMIRGNLLTMFPGLLTIMLQMCNNLNRTDLSNGLTRNIKILRTYKHRHNKLEAVNMSKNISLNIVNICRLLTFNLITTPYNAQRQTGSKSCLTASVNKLLSLPTFLLFNAGGQFLESEVQV